LTHNRKTPIDSDPEKKRKKKREEEEEEERRVEGVEGAGRQWDGPAEEQAEGGKARAPAPSTLLSSSSSSSLGQNL
jgi:hypothetical protein